MIKSNLALKCDNNVIDIPEWNYFVSELQKIFKLSKDETAHVKNSFTAKIIASIPFAANCSEPERIAISHLCIYMAEIKGFQKYLAHRPTDDISPFKRLLPISHFNDGDEKVINEGLTILALIMLEGYNHSKEIDKINNVYNPLVNNKWNYEQLKDSLIEDLYNNHSGLYPELSDIDYVWS